MFPRISCITNLEKIRKKYFTSFGQYFHQELHVSYFVKVPLR